MVLDDESGEGRPVEASERVGEQRSSAWFCFVGYFRGLENILSECLSLSDSCVLV